MKGVCVMGTAAEKSVEVGKGSLLRPAEKLSPLGKRGYFASDSGHIYIRNVSAQ